jgi:ketosteroid isomerase-like protein
MGERVAHGELSAAVRWLHTVPAVEQIVCGARLVAASSWRSAERMSNIAELDKKLNDAVLAGKALEAFEELYDDNVVMQENSDPEFRGKDLNRKREQEFFASVEAWHGGSVLASAAHGDVSFSEWTMDISLKGVGRVSMAQVAVRRWKNGKIVHERFYHK